MSGISIKKMIIHILDSNLQMPVISEEEHVQGEDITEFIEKHIEKILGDDNLRTAHFSDSNSSIKRLLENLASDSNQFIPTTQTMASKLFELMKKHVEILPSDLFFCAFEADRVLYLAVLKFNYKSSYIHYVENDGSRKVNTIIKQNTALPNENQKIDECAIINLNDFSIKVIEKKCEINGENMYYFSQLFLDCSSQASISERVKMFNKATEKFNKKYFEDDINKKVEIKKAVMESIEESEVINVPKIAHTVFGNNPELKDEYMSEISKTGLKDTIPVTEKIYNRKFRTQKITTDSGIEINLPVDFYSDKDKIEFINNPDGSISILIKNVFKAD